jgi:hypothetical protein
MHSEIHEEHLNSTQTIKQGQNKESFDLDFSERAVMLDELICNKECIFITV